MSGTQIISNYELFTDINGKPLDAGYVWIGQPNTDPRLFPLPVYFDAALTIPATMPLRTSNGYIDHNGARTFVYISGNYSIRVENKNTSLIYSIADFLATGNLLDSGVVSFNRGGVGSVSRTVSDKLKARVSPEDYGAVGDNIIDDTAAMIRALVAGLKVELELGKTYYCAGQLGIQYDGQILTGHGNIRSGATTAILASGKTGVIIEKIGIQSAGSGSASVGVQFLNCTNSYVRFCTFSAYRQYGVLINGTSSNCKASENLFLAMAVNASYGVPSGNDIGIEQNATFCQASYNVCNSGGGTAIQVRNYRDNVQHCDNHIIEGNQITGYNSYGIVLYRDGPYPPDVEANLSVYGCIVANNRIKEISGSRPSTAGGIDYIFGSGIYVQGAEHFSITGNVISRTHTFGTNTELLAPGAIGLANVGDGTVIGNAIYDPQFDGVNVNDSNQLGAVDGGIVISGNTIHGSVKRAIRSAARGNLVISSNTIGNCNSGVLVNAGSGVINSDNLVIVANKITSISNSPISVSIASDIIIADNVITGGPSDEIVIGVVNGADIHDNIMSGHTLRGINIQAGSSGVILVKNNTVTGNGSSSTVGILVSSPAVVEGNQVSGHVTANYSGNFAPGQPLPDNTTPDVTSRTYAKLSPAAPITITNFLNGKEDQTLVLRTTNANVTLQVGTIVLQGGINFVMGNGAVITLRKESSQWIEISRRT